MNATGALFYVLIGAFALFVAKGSARGRLIGLTAVTFGVPLIVRNLFIIPDPWLNALVLVSMDLIATATATALAWHLVANSPSRVRRGFILCAALILGGFLLSLTLVWRDPSIIDQPDRLAIAPRWIGFDALMSGMSLVAVASGTSFAAAHDAKGRRAVALLALSMGAFPLFFVASSFARLVRLSPAEFWLWLALIAASCAPWFLATRGPDARVARNVLLALLGSALIGLVFWAAVRINVGRLDLDFGVPGVVRTFAAVALVLAIVRHDLLQRPLPTWSVQRGTIAAIALAALLVVAQMAQNFLSAEYGLLMGGVVAGALLVAARPIERALEGRRGVRAPLASEEAYRKAVRFALRDRQLTREEELHLHEIAEQMGLSGRRAHELLSEVEREVRAQGPPPWGPRMG